MKVVTFSIERMVCQGCAEKITDVLEVADGVQGIRTNARKKLVKVEFDPDRTDDKALETTLTNAGYLPKKVAQ